MKIIQIVAVAENQAIGKDNRLLWRLPNDMKFFKDHTEGHCVVTGRRNYESIPEKFRPLPLRTNIVVTRQENYSAPGAIVVTTIEAAVAEANKLGEDRLYIIGGGEIYKQTLDMSDEILFTRVHHNFDADTFFPALDMNDWKEDWREEHAADEKHAYAYTFYRYVRH
jgi:dihydrofolate reductase